MFLFDIDGTLISSAGAGVRALERAAHELFGLADAMAGIVCDGMTDPAIARDVLSPHGLDSAVNRQNLLERYVHFLKGSVAESQAYKVLPGVVDSLEYLGHTSKAICGLATGNVKAGAKIKLERGGLNPYFLFGGFGSDAEQRAELVAAGMERGRKLLGDSSAAAVVIGDTPRDVAAAHLADAFAVGVASSNFDSQQLNESGADLVLESLEKPAKWVEQVRILLKNSRANPSTV